MSGPTHFFELSSLWIPDYKLAVRQIDVLVVRIVDDDETASSLTLSPWCVDDVSVLSFLF